MRVSGLIEDFVLDPNQRLWHLHWWSADMTQMVCGRRVDAGLRTQDPDLTRTCSACVPCMARFFKQEPPV